MIEVVIPSDPKFMLHKNEIKMLYENSQKSMSDPNTFDFVIKNTFFYAFFDTDILIGGIYFFPDEGKLFMNGFAGKKHHLVNLECVRMSLNWFNCDIFAEAQNRASALCLLKCGFKRVKDNLFKYKNIKK